MKNSESRTDLAARWSLGRPAGTGQPRQSSLDRDGAVAGEREELQAAHVALGVPAAVGVLERDTHVVAPATRREAEQSGWAVDEGVGGG